jgi:NAD(P)-dependent dehydrogenase (short-subunit alcohol dehydrogenase family)
MASQKKIAFISGGNRGIGLETARELGKQGYRIVIGARNGEKGAEAVRTLAAERIEADFVIYDAKQRASDAAVYEHLAKTYGRLDVLVNNAGMLEEALDRNSTLSVDEAVIEQTFATNLFAVVRLTRALLPLLEKSDAGRIVNVSSILGSLTLHATPGSPIAQSKAFAYNASKAALNAFTIHLADALRDTSIKVNSIHPGWVKTELGGSSATDEVTGSGHTSARLASIDASGPSGGFFHLDSTLPW